MKSEDIARYVAGLEEEVERLQALPALPDVGLVTRGSSGFLRLDGANWDDDAADEYRHLAACYLALAAFKDAEAAAADTTPDQPQSTLEVDGVHALLELEDVYVGDDTVQAVIRALDAHRAARTSEGGAA